MKLNKTNMAIVLKPLMKLARNLQEMSWIFEKNFQTINWKYFKRAFKPRVKNEKNYLTENGL